MKRNRTPAETMETLVQCRAAGDLEGALAMYEEDATIVVSPTASERGTSSVRAFLENYMQLKPTFVVLDRHFVVAVDVALHLSRWSLSGVNRDQEPFRNEGLSADVLRRQLSGDWLVAIDNPFAI